MQEINQDSSGDSTADIRIVSLNRDKTRRISGSNTEYRVHFELSGTPPQAWRNIFEQKWKALTLPADPENGMPETSMNGKFLLLHSPLQKTTAYLSVLKQIITATNETFGQYLQEQETEQEHREDEWKKERRDVDTMAESLHF
jgi:hypothetical protein